MSHPRVRPGSASRLPAITLIPLLLAAVLPWMPTASAAARSATATPLTIRLVRLSPAAIPSKGQVVLAGSVSNPSEETWIGVNVHPFISSSPMTTRDELATAAAVDPTADVGSRLTDPGQFTAVGDLAPGQRAPFKIVLPVQDLPISGRPGVYWIGVHALGQSTAGGRSVLARARTFIPLVGNGSPHTSVALVVPVREPVRRDRVGRLLGASQWSDTLDPSGRLGRIAGFLASAGSRPLTMAVDPSVLDAVSDLIDNNPAISLGKPVEQTPSSSPSPSRSGSRLDAGDRADASTWLTQITTAAGTHTVLGLGYADPDVSALVRLGSPLLSQSAKLAAQTFKDLKIQAVPAVEPAGGWLDDDAFTRLSTETTVLVSDHSAPRTHTLWLTPSGQHLVFADAQASSGGPGPTTPTSVLAIRQRIIADAALRTLQRPTDPLVVELPEDWNPGAGWQAADFFNALAVPWLDLVQLNPSAEPSAPTFDAALGYPASEQRLEVPGANAAAAGSLTRTATALSQLLRSENNVEHQLKGIALNAVSVHARRDASTARDQVSSTNAAVRRSIGKVEVLGTDFVTLSGGSGTLAITVVNGLDQPVVVGVESRTSTTDVTVAASKPVKMAPGERTVLRLKAKASAIGVTRVVLTPVTEEGTQLGTPLAFSLRTSQVGQTIWGVLIAGGVLIVVMVIRRIRRGLREHRWKGRG